MTSGPLGGHEAGAGGQPDVAVRGDLRGRAGHVPDPHLVDDTIEVAGGGAHASALHRGADAGDEGATGLGGRQG